jgi:hypothetical protein
LIKRIRVDFQGSHRPRLHGCIENGFIIVDAVRLTGQILHATIVGPRASEMISFFTLAISQKISLYKIYRLVYPYPTFSSGILKVADFFMRDTLPNLGKELAAYLKYRFAKPKSKRGKKEDETYRIFARCINHVADGLCAQQPDCHTSCGNRPTYRHKPMSQASSISTTGTAF